MGKTVVALLLVVLVPVLAAAGEYVSLGASPGPVSVRVLESSPARVELEFTFGGYERTPVEMAVCVLPPAITFS